MTMTHKEWRRERALLTKAVESAGSNDKRGLIEKAFRRAIAFLDDQPPSLVPTRADAIEEARINRDYDALDR